MVYFNDTIPNDLECYECHFNYLNLSISYMKNIAYISYNALTDECEISACLILTVRTQLKFKVTVRSGNIVQMAP